MRKTAALPLGVALVLGLRPALLHTSLQLIGIWLTPLFGTQSAANTGKETQSPKARVRA